MLDSSTTSRHPFRLFTLNRKPRSPIRYSRLTNDTEGPAVLELLYHVKNLLRKPVAKSFQQLTYKTDMFQFGRIVIVLARRESVPLVIVLLIRVHVRCYHLL